jgi:hypothetical protein
MARKRRAQPQKIRPPKQTPLNFLDASPFHINFPITLHHKSENKFCYFVDEFHLKKYMDRCKLKLKDVEITQTASRQ